MSEKTYHEQLAIDNTLRLREVLASFPSFTRDYFRSIEQTTSSKTRISYAYDLKVFFNYLLEANPLYKDKTIKDIALSDLTHLLPVDIEEYQEYLKLYRIKEKQQTNSEQGISRKMSSLRSFFNYYYRHKALPSNPAILVDMPKLHDKNIIRLDSDEVTLLLDSIEVYGESLKGQKRTYFEKTKYRDIAILTLLLGTGLRVSECVGLDLDDVDFKNNGLKIVRKGGNEMVVYFGTEVEEALEDYLDLQRNAVSALPGHENALFLSMQRKRISVDAIENLVGKYTKALIPSKHITPHKLRSTYGTALYKETGDIYLVADVLGHKDVNTTRKHYAAIDDDHRKKAATMVSLRKNKNPKSL